MCILSRSSPFNYVLCVRVCLSALTNVEAGMESNKSIITHLLSQVRIGMDLTKVVLPTFILEKRSMLEMYADFFAHSDLYAR